MELEKLEKRLFLRGRLPTRPEPEGAEAEAEEEKSETPPHPVDLKSQEFELLKRATGNAWLLLYIYLLYLIGVITVTMCTIGIFFISAS